MPSPGDILSYVEMCSGLGVSLQRGMNFQLRGHDSLILMSLQQGAPYADRIEEGGRVLIYEGHDIARVKNGPNPKEMDQPEFYPGGRRTQNGLFLQAAERFKSGEAAHTVQVFEKIRAGIWAYNGLFRLTDGWRERSGGRMVFKFRLELTDQPHQQITTEALQVNDDRVIPSAVKLEVWKRDKGSCVVCGSKKNLHFDHVIPYSQGGSSKNAKNIQILCAKHNLAKHDQIM